MEDSFRVRVDKVFGPLLSANNTNPPPPSPPSPSPSPSPSLWSLSDEEIEKKEWKRGSTNTMSPDAFFAAALPPQPPKPQEEEEEEEDHENHREMMKELELEVEGEQVWEIRSSIGLDCTLDYEEEEDVYDKVAIGMENACDRPYVQDMVDYAIDVNDHNELPNSFNQVTRDPRANHVAAKLRLREDAEAAGDFHTLKLSDILDPSVSCTESHQSETAALPKPILKKREISMDGKSPKRVRFEERYLVAKGSDRRSGSVEGTSSLGQTICLPQKSFSNEEAAVIEDVTILPGISSRVPDYLRNPAKYKRYTLDPSNDMDEASNQMAYMEFLNMLNKPNTTELQQVDEASPSFQHPLTFTPRKKLRNSSMVKEDELKHNQPEDSGERVFPVSIAAADTQDGEACAMEEDGMETVVGKSFLKPGRRYRSRTNVDSDDDVT